MDLYEFLVSVKWPGAIAFIFLVLVSVARMHQAAAHRHERWRHESGVKTEPAGKEEPVKEKRA